MRKLWSVHDRGDDGGGGDGDHVCGSDGDDDGVDGDEDDGKKDDYGDCTDSYGSCSVAYFRHLIRKELQLADMLLMILQNLKILYFKTTFPYICSLGKALLPATLGRPGLDHS